MTLFRFLRDYIYIPIGGNNRRTINILFTMLLAGLWHGTGWTFILWARLHGFYCLQTYVTKLCIQTTLFTHLLVKTFFNLYFNYHWMGFSFLLIPPTSTGNLFTKFLLALLLLSWHA
jgi:D-alanyl-lipoteichoic acid acyltransferase DltB (MBOAT superfamily)